MGDAKRITVKPISASDASRLIRGIHYSGKVTVGSQLHFGVFLDGKCGGAMQFGPSLDKRRMVGLVSGTLWNEFLELNRLALADWLPRNGESRSLAFAFRFIRKHYPQIKWVVSFSDGTQCGDGTIYRAAGFDLIGIKPNKEILQAPSGEIFNYTSIKPNIGGRVEIARARNVLAKTASDECQKETGASSVKKYLAAGWQVLPGFQLKYIYFLDPTARERLTVPILPFSEIVRRGAGMYRGKPRVRSDTGDTPSVQDGKGGSIPTRTLSMSSGQASSARPSDTAARPHE